MDRKRENIFVTNKDMKKLRNLLSSGAASTRDKELIRDLEDELDTAEIVDFEQIPRDVITMNTNFTLRDLDTDKLRTFTLVYPQDADILRGKLSILAPVGIAVLGYSVGDVIDWEVPSGKRRFRVESIIYQPEENGHC